MHARLRPRQWAGWDDVSWLWARARAYYDPTYSDNALVPETIDPYVIAQKTRVDRGRASLEAGTMSVQDFMLERACEEISELRARVKELETDLSRTRQAFIDEACERAFWQRAAEQALRMWGLAQDEVDELQQQLAGSRPCEH